MKSILVFFVVAVMAVSSLSFAITIHVPSEQPTIQAGIDAAVDGDTVLVAAGSYSENLIIDSKGITLLSTSGSSVTTLAPQSVSEHILHYLNNAEKENTIQGFTFTGVVGISCVSFNSSGFLAVTDNKFTDNDVGFGALQISGNCFIKNNEFVNNQGEGHGGALYLNTPNSSVVECNVFRNNAANYGGGIDLLGSDSTIVRYNLFVGNSSSSYGGAIYLGGATNITIHNNTIDSCVSEGDVGGGIAYWVSTNVVSFNNIIVNCDGYAIWQDGSSSFWEDYNDCYGNSPSNYYGISPGAGSISTDPLFVAGTPFSYDLQPVSPCIDAGDPDPQYNDRDGSRNDMGAFPLCGFGYIVVSDIPDQTIAEGGSFAVIVLDDYVEDILFADDQIQWAYTGNSDLGVTIDPDRVAAISVPHPDWFGEEIITFRGINPFGCWDSDTATFTVTPLNDPPVIADIPDQVVRHHQPFPLLLLDDYVEDIDDPDSQLLWTYSGNSVLTIDIDAQRIVTITPPSPDWTGTDTVIFTVTDTAMATDEDTVALTSLENVPPEAPVLLSPTDDELVDTLFPVLTIQNSYDDEDDSLIYTFEVSLNSSFYFPQTFQKKADDDTATSAIVQQILEENTRYWWRVKASDYYAESGFSEVQTFYVNVVNELPTIFSLIGPGSPAGGDATTLTPEFVWMLSTDPDPFDTISYTLFVAIDSNFSFVVSTPDITDTCHVIGYELEWDMEYWWKVKAEDLHGGTTWSSEVFRFQPIPWTCGDADGSLVVEISDAVYLINYIFIPDSPAPNPYESGDADCTGVVEISDAVYLINYIFIPGSPEPCDPDGDGEPDC